MGDNASEKGKRDGIKGEKEYFEYAVNPEYQEAYDYGEGLRKGSELANVNPLISGVVEGVEKVEKSDSFKRGYDHGKPWYMGGGRHRSTQASGDGGSATHHESSYGGGDSSYSGGGSSTTPYAIFHSETNYISPWRYLGILLGFGIAALSLYIGVRLGMEDKEGTPLWIACATLIWLAPLMACARKPLYVLLSFILFGITAGLLFGLPYLEEHYPEYYQAVENIGKGCSPGEGVLVGLGMIFGGIVILIIGIIIPLYLMIEAFSDS